MKLTGRIAALGLVVIMLAVSLGCASIVSKSSYPVTITSTPEGADITISDEAGTVVHSGKTPDTVTLNAKRGFWTGKDYVVTFSKDGYEDVKADLKRGVDGWYILGNLVFEGLIGWLIVDPATGAMWTLDKEVSVSLESRGSSMNPGSPSLTVVDYNDIPEHLRDRLVRVN